MNQANDHTRWQYAHAIEKQFGLSGDRLNRLAARRIVRTQSRPALDPARRNRLFYFVPDVAEYVGNQRTNRPNPMRCS